MPVENDTSHQNGQQDAGGGGGNGNVPTETSSQPQQAPEPNATIVNGTHAKVSDAPEDQLAKDAPKDAKKSDGSASFLRAARAGNLEKVLEFLKTNTDINTCNANGLNALHLASKEGHVNVVRELLQRGANVDAATKKGNTALHIASLAGQEEIVKVLVQHQALVNIQSQNGFTPLYMAAQENHDSVVRFLLANNANQSLATEDGFTPLAVALQQGHDKVVAVLLENDTRGKVRLPALHIAAKKDDTKAAALLLHTDHNPDVTSKSGFTPLHIASHYGNENIANLLIQRGADVNYIAKHQITPLHVASKWGKGNMVSLLIDKGANYEAKTRDGLTPLHCAARSGHEAVVDMLLEKGAPITSKTKNGLAPLHMASQGDHVDAARILLYHKAPVDDVTVDFLTALHVAAHCGHVRVAKLLLDRKAEANARALNGFTPLHIACKKNRIKVVELLLKHGASIEATTESGLTPLHVASFMGCMNIVIYLLQHSATADVPTVRGETPLHLAARANQTDIIRILLRNGAQVDARAREQQTALHIASRLGNSDIVVLLLQHGAAVDATTKDHYTALHIAAKEGQEEVASVLLEHGASLTSTTKKGFTPLHLAAKYGNMKVARLLLQKDALVDAQGKNGVTPLHVAAHYDHQNVALLLLDKGASPHATAKNGYTPLHIAARKNQMDIATTLLEYGASANAESKAGFTPLHLSSQEGHTDMATLLIEHNAAPGACAKNGLTPLHLCGQEDRVNVAAILVKHGAQIDPVTKAGYTPLHVACHFGQMNMVRFLLQHGAKVNSTTQLGYTPLHQAAQQGHTQIVNLLLENKAEPNTETNDGKTALSIAQRLGYISVVETLKIVTETTINTTTTTTTEEKYKVVVPETMHETFMSESEDEGGDDTMVSSMFGKPQHVTLPYYEGQFRYTSDDTMLGDQSYRYLTVDEMKSLGDDSLPIDVTKDEKMDMSFSSNQMAAPPVAPADHLSPQHQKEHYAQMTASYPADNVDVGKTPILAGYRSFQSLGSGNRSSVCSFLTTNSETPQNDWPFFRRFLVSFMVDARGGAMRGCRHSGVRVIIPPRKAAMPMRVTCRYLKKDKLVHAPPLMEGEALASRILEMGPAGAKFLGPVIIEVPHFASLRGKEREIVILRSDNGETWREHTLEATEEAVQEVLNESFDGEELKQLEDLNTNRITRILTTDFPQYFAIVTRIRQEVHAIGPEGGMVSSTVVPQVQAVFPQGALTKKIKVGLQAQPIPTDLVAKLLGNRVAVSPIVTVEPRRRKFHKPITLTIPVPQASSKGMINQYSGEAPTLRLLCSITGVFRKRSLKGGTTRAQWEDVTGSTPLTFVNDCVSFTTTVSARFWLMDCSNIPEATKMATELYREAIHVPFMAKFVVFSKRHQLEEARMRVFCMTDDREDKTLEHQELFVEVAKSRDVEVLEGKPQFLEFAGNLVPVTKSGDQLAFNFYAFRENRLPFTVRVKDQHADPIGRVAFMRQPKVGRGDPPQTPICNLNIALPDNIQPEPAPSEPDLLALEKKYSFLSISKADTIHRANLRLTDISNMLGTDWVALAHELEVTDSDINIIKSQYPDNAPQQAIVMLRLWMQTAGNKASGNTVGKALRKINREDIVKQCIFNVEVVTDDIERAMAKAHFDQSGFDTFKDELGPSRDATLNRDVSLDVSYDEQDMMKEAESAEEEEENQRAYHDKSSREQHTADLSPTYESEEKKYAGEEKVVTDEKVTKEEAADDSTTFTSFTATSTPIKRDTKEEEKLETDKKDKASKPAQIVPDTLQESKEETTVTDKDAKKPVEELVTKESISKEEPKSLEKEKPVTVVKEKIKEKEDDTTPMVKEKVKPEEKKEKDEKPEASQKEPEKTVTSTTKTEVVGGPKDITTVTTETKSYTTAEDGSVQEHIVVKKQTSKVVDGKEMEEDKSAILQKLGEELGKLDEQLEEKFKKRKAEKPEVVQEEVKEEAVVAQRREGQTQPTSQVVVEHGSEPPTLPATTTTTTTSITPIPDGFTQASVESSQMSSTRGTADVSFPGADTAVKQLDGALTQQTVPWIEDGRISHEDLPLQSSYHKKGHSQAISAILPADQAHSNRTEERGCSPITVLEARHNAEEMSGKLHARGSSHTITTTTSWGAPLSATTNIQIEDENSPHCLQFTLHSESRVTLHASKDVIQDLQLVKQQQEQKQPQELYQTSSEKKYHEGTSDSCVPEEIFDRNEDQETHEKLDKLLDISTAEKPLLKSEEIETSDLKHSEYRQKDSINEKIVSQTEKEIISSNVTRVEDAPEVYSTSVVFSSEDKIVPRETSAEEAKRVTPETINSEALAALGDDHDQAASEVTASSAHRPTTLMITSNSNESSDDAECTTNDPTRLGGENDIPQDPEQGGGMAGEEESKQEESDRKQSTAVGERLSGSESGAVPRLERSMRSSPRTTTLVKVKVEKRPVGSHSQVRDRNSHDHMTVVRTHSVEEEVRGLMQEVKEATSQIKQEVKELRQADTPTPDTPTPLREFKEFLNREEEQEQERLPTIKEICRESEEDSSAGMGAPSIFGKRPGIESFFYKGFFLPSGTHEASQPTEHQTSLPQEQAASSQPTSGTKAGSADGKTKLTEADLAVLESMVVAQEAEMEEMAFKIEAEAAQAKIELEGSYLTNNDAVSIEKGMEKQMIRNKPVNQKADVPVHSSVSISPFKSESLRCTDTDTGQHHGDPSKKTTGVASMASARESSKAVAEAPEASHISSDEGEEQLMIMRDSPRWEDEEIQAEESDEPRTIKAEIKLLVKTTEVGKESIEIRSIREFVENENADVISSEGVVQSPAVDSSQLVPGDVQHLQSTSSDLCSPSPKFTRPQVASTYSSICEPTQDEFDLMAQVRDGGLHGGCPEAQGMDWEGKSVDSMLTESVMQARLSMLPAVDTNEGVALPSQPSSTSPPVASTHLSSPSNPDLPFLTTLQPQASSSQDSPGNKSQTFLHLEPSHLHDSNSFEPQGFDVSPSSATKLSDPVLLERSFVCGAEASTASHLVASPSIASLQSESFTPFIATEELGAASVTFNTSSAMISMGPVSPTENSSEDHAEIERTSTEISPDSVRFDQDILDTRTEDEAPDLDDDLIPSSPVPGQELSERVFSIEATEDTDITTPMEMRDSHTERDASASNLIEDKEVTDGKSDLKEPLPISDKDENNAYLAQEVNDIINKVNRLQEQVKAKEIDPISARSEIKVILNTLDDVREVIEESKVEDDSEANVVGIDILSNIDSVGEMVMQMMKELHLTDPEHSEFWSKDEAKVSHETECAVAETITTEDKSPPSANQPDQSFSDLIDSEEFNRDSLEDEFDRLTADLSSPPKSDKIEFIPKAIGATAPSNDLSFPVSSVVHPPIPPDAFQATQLESDVGVVFTERKEYGGGVKTSAETTGGHSHISPSPVLHPSQSIQSSSSASFQQKLPCTTSVNVEDTQSSHDEPHVPSRPSRRHERTFSQATNIFTGAIPTETKVESKKVEDIKEEQVGITEDIKPYSERKQFWESVTSQSFESKSSHLLKSETESDTDTTGTDGTVLEQKVRKTKVSSTESNDSESEYLAQRVDPRFYENAGFAGTEKIDVSTESARERTISPFEVLRSGEPMTELPSPEDIAFKDVSSKRALFEKEIKRQSMEIEESQSWKRSSKEYDETLVVSEETASSTLKKKEERESKISETIEKDKEIKKKFESKKDDLSKTDFKTEITSKSDKSSSVEDRSEVTESSKLHQEKMQKKEEKVTSELGAMGKKSVTQRDASTEKREKEVSEKEAKIIHEKKDSYSRTFSKSISKSEEKTESSSEAKETVHTLSTDDQDTSKDEMTEEDITRTEETSDEEPEEKLAADKTTVDVTEESRQLGDTRETVVRETTTTREGDQEQRVVKETKTQETAMADGSTIKTTSITTFTTQLETKDQEESKPYSAKTAKEKAEAYVKQQMKSDIFSEELSSSAEDQSPEHKVLTPKDTIAPVSRAQKSHPLSSPILVPEEKIEDVVWEVSQERSETVLSETVEDIPVQQSYETQHVRDLSSDESRVLEKPQPEQATEATKHKLSEEEARKLAIEIVEEVKTEAVKRSPLVTPSQTFQEFPQELEDTTDGAARPPLPIPIPESAFTQETTTKIEKYIQEQLGEEMDEKQLKLIESVTAKKTELLHRKLIGGQYQHSMEITDEDLRSSGAELSPIEHHMERLRQMTEEEDNQRYAREPSEADESESSIIIHDTVDDVISSEYDQATQMISKTLDSIKTADISRVERPIDTIEELPETPVMPVVEVKERKMSEVQEVARFSDSDIKETARQIVKEVTEIAKESDVVKQASQAADSKQASGGQDQAISCSPKSGSKPGSRKGSWMDDEDLTREFRKDYEDKKKMFKEEMTSDKSDTSDAKDDGAVKVKHQRSSESQKEVPMESSMTESMEESSAVESIRSIEGKLKQETVPEIREGEIEKKIEERSSSSHEEVVMRKKTHIEEFSRRSGADFDTYSSSGESHYFTAAEGTSDSRTASRPCSSDVEALISERTGTSEYDTALTSQDTSQYSSYSSSSREYRTAASSMSSRDSMKSIDSESSGNLASVELSEASETLVPSAMELERDMDLLDQEIMEEDQSHFTQAHPSIIPQLTVQSDTPKSEGAPCTFDLESDEGESEPEVKEKEHHVASRMKRSVEMTFHPEPVPIAECKKGGVTESVASSLEESTLSEMSVVTVVERERSLQSSVHSEPSMSASGVSEQMASSSECPAAAHSIMRTDSGVLTTDTGDGDMALHSVTITATSVPSTTDSSTASMCTQVTSETRSQAELTESEQFFHANGPTEVDYVPEYDDEVRGVRPVAAPVLPPIQEVSGAVAGPSEGPQKVTVVEECYETEADQEYGQMMRESEYSDMAEAELQYSLEEQPESEMSSMLGIEEPIERPKTPEPGYVPSSRPSQVTAQSLDESEEFTEVDKRFSAIFSTTYEEREEGARSLVSGLSVDIPDIRVTEHTLPMPSQYCYPDLEREEDFPECQVQAEVDASGQDVPATPGSQESASTCASRKSSSTDSEQGREYCLDDAAQGLPFESFEMIEAGDIEDFLEYEKTLRMHEKRMLEMSQIQEEEEEEVEEEQQKVHTSPIMPSQLKAVKLEAKILRSSDSQSQVSDEGSEEADSTIEEQRRWLELQFEESSVSNFEYSQPSYMQHVYSGPLEDIEEEKEDAERRDLSHVVKGSSLSSTPEYDVLAGRKFFTRSGEHDDVSMSSLQEFENLERSVAVDAVARRSSSGSQESLNGKKPEGKSGQGDDISVGSFASLQEFERLEEECLEAENIEKKVKEEEAMLSEIEEGHESQVSESESCETMSEPGQASVDGEEYDQRMFEIDEIIRQAQTNVEKFDKTKPGYEGVQLQDIVSNGSGSSRADRTPSVGREEGDADSLEEAQLPELDLDQSAPGATSTKQDVMTLSTDSIETPVKQKVPRETSQDSLEKVVIRTSDPMATSVDSIDMASRHDPMTTSIDSLEGRRRGQDPMSASTDSIDPYRRDVMATSIDSLGKDDSSGRDADISSGSEQVRPLPRDGLMEWSTDSLEPTSSQATHAIYHQYDTDSIMSGSFASGCSNTLVASTEGLPDMMTSSMYLPEGELPPLEGEGQHTHYVHTSSGSAAETVAPSSEPGFSHSVTRVVKLPPEAHQVTFTGPDAQKKLEEYIKGFNAGQHSVQDETVDDQGNVHIRRVTQTRIVAEPERTQEHGFSVSEPSTVETEECDEHGNVTRVIRRTVVTSHTIEVDLDTGEPIVQASSSTPSKSSTSASTSTSSPSISRIPRPVTSPPQSRSQQPGPPPGLRGPCEPVPPSLEPNTVSGLDVEEMSSGMEGYASDGNDPMTTTHITRYDPDPLPITTSTTTTTTTTTTRIIRRTKEEDGEVKEEEEIFEEY
ncbi:ankyrin-2-like isoform X8 [Portunus trituberculatus]|uniref:ankyrin-2-like isoform X8 n=1 Tax=Portunus trituberculatus TaxID=210409 RepID=UPI001E1D0C6E|nr:ankyrin-2-like isoform X8 [Portunus trituberculatus]